MIRNIATFTTVLLFAGICQAAAPLKSVDVLGTMDGGVTVTAHLTPADKALLTGSGTMTVKNPQTKSTSQYHFYIQNASTAGGALTLYGRFTTGFTTGPSMTITAKVPTGKLTLTYQLPNGKSATISGQGSVKLNY